MKKMRDIIDTWNLIEKYEIEGWKEEGRVILVPDSEYDRLMGIVKNKQYIKNITIK